MGYSIDSMSRAALTLMEVAGTVYGEEVYGEDVRSELENGGEAEGVSAEPSPEVSAETGPGAADVSAETESDPENPDDAVEELGDEIATLAAHIHAARHRLLVLLARFDRLRGWEPGGHRSCAHWLAFRTGLDIGTAREHVRVARSLEDLPETSRTMSRGRLSFSQVRALTRVTEPANESDLLELAEGCTTAQLERMVRAWKKGSRQDEAARERERHRRRKLAVFPDDEGMYVVTGRLTPEVGSVLMRAIEAASDALYREQRAERADPEEWPPAEEPSERQRQREARQRRADAIGLLAERALAAGFGAGSGDEASGEDGEDAAENEAPISGTRAERYQVMLHVEPETLAAEGEPGRSELEDGTRVSAETARRLCCDAAVVRVTRDPEDGSVLDVGRKTRTIPSALRRALEVRDRGCRFPGCGLRFTAGHHIFHWADGGPTSLANTLLLCRHHHRLVHEGGWKVEWWGEGRPAFHGPRGQLHLDPGWSPPEDLPEAPVAALVRRNRDRGADPDGMTAGARWKWERDIPNEVLFRALEAGL